MTENSPVSDKLRYRANEPLISPTAYENVRRVLDERYLSPGGWVNAFEARWAETCGARFAVATSSGTAALHIAMLAAGVRPGDEVIVPAMTCPDTLNAAAFIGAQPVIIDVEPERYGMDPALVAGAVTSRTRAVVPVHLYGCPVQPELFEICTSLGLLVIEDAAEAHGARLDDRMVGTVGTVGCFSFRGDKVLGVGTGGMIVTDDADLARRAHYMIGLASPGGWERYSSTEFGYSYELSNVHAAIGVAQLEVLQETIAAKERIASWYDAMLPAQYFQSPSAAPGHVWWRYTPRLVRHRPADLHAALLRRGIETLPPFTPMYRLPMYKAQHDAVKFPVAEDLYARLISLPASPYLTRDDIAVIVDTCVDCLADLPEHEEPARR